MYFHQTINNLPSFLHIKHHAWVGSTSDFTFCSAWIQNLNVLLFSLRFCPFPQPFQANKKTVLKLCLA